MKNKIVTLICIFAIVATTAVVALAGGTDTKYTNDVADPQGSETLIDLEIIPEGSVSGEYLVPGGTLERTIQASTGAADEPIIFRTFIAFESDTLDRVNDYKNAFTIAFSDNDDWNMSNGWQMIEYEGEYYCMTSAVYNGVLAANSSDSMKYTVTMDSSVTADFAKRFEDGNGYHVMAVTQAVQANGWKSNTGAATMDANTIEDILDQVFGEVDSDYRPDWNAEN